MVVARTPEAREALKAQFQAHTIERAYQAIVVGEREGRRPSRRSTAGIPATGCGSRRHVRQGKRAVTHVRVLERFEGATFVECTLETGRTHQIRVHLAEGGTPVLGDPLYGKPAPRPGRLVRHLAKRLGHQALHARLLGFVHPGTGARVRSRPRRRRLSCGSPGAASRSRCRRLSSESATKPTSTANHSVAKRTRIIAAVLAVAVDVPELLQLPLQRRLGHAEPARHGHERAGERARGVEEGREAEPRRLVEAAAGSTQSAAHSSDHAPIERTVGTTRLAGRTSVARLS